MKKILYLSLLFSIISCKDDSFNFEMNAGTYNSIKDCLIQNKNKIFSDETLPAVSLYPHNLQQTGTCSEYLPFIYKQKISFISIDKNNTVKFFEDGMSGLKSMQYILIHVENKELLKDEVSGDSKEIGSYGQNWYRFEKVISLAN